MSDPNEFTKKKLFYENYFIDGKEVIIDHSIDNTGSDIFTLTEKIIRDVEEEEDRFIFMYLTPFLTSTFKQVIPKKLLVRAITTFAREHPEEYQALLDEAQDKESK